MVTWYISIIIMAALIRHGFQKRGNVKLTSGNILSMITCNKSYWFKNKPKKPIRGQTIESTADSLSAKGFLRSQKEYTPRDDVKEKFYSICQSISGDSSTETQLSDSDLKFKILNACFQEFKHGVPNSLLHTMETTGDVLNFYTSSVDVTLPLDGMKRIELPPNLHIQYDYNRFHPETDTMFGGISAFPKSSTIVTGLKYRKKYKGYTAKTSWP